MVRRYGNNHAVPGLSIGTSSIHMLKNQWPAVRNSSKLLVQLAIILLRISTAQTYRMYRHMYRTCICSESPPLPGCYQLQIKKIGISPHSRILILGIRLDYGLIILLGRLVVQPSARVKPAGWQQ
jgi:hypothetical protein